MITREQPARGGRGVLWVLCAVLCAVTCWPAMAQQQRVRKDPQLVPNRLSSIGDSITTAVDAELPFANRWASWSNGYTNFWTWLFGLSNVDSHNQRISRNFGKSGRRNYIEAHAGDDSSDFLAQATKSVIHQATYVTVFLGHNDVCGDRIDRIPTDEEFEGWMRDGFDVLSEGLPPGATVQVVGLVDIYQLWALGKDLSFFGLLDCRVLWATSLIDLFPCGTMLSPRNSAADREFVRNRNIAFNTILEELALEYDLRDPRHHYFYTNDAFEYQFSPDDVSGLDCFHPSSRGQRALSRTVWQAGPFAPFNR